MAIDDNTSYELTGYQVKDLASKVRAKADSSSLASVATSGLYSDLTGAPTIPTVYNGTLTIQHNGTTKGTFTANQSTASTVNIETIYADDQIVTTPIDWSNILSHFYPVGSIYMSATLSTAAAVSEALGGTWVAWGAGRVPVGVDTSDADFDTAEETGGEKKHALTTQEMPPHSHATKSVDAGAGSQGKANGTYYQGGWWGNYDSTTTTGGASGTVVAHNNLQPYITCYMYKRTA